MSAPLPTLADILTDEADLYEQLLTLLGEEEAALVAGDPSPLADCVARKETLTLKLRLAEHARQVLVTRLGSDPGTRLAELPGVQGEELDRAATRLKALLARVQRANSRVEALLARALVRIRTTLELIQDAAGVSRGYSANAQLVSGSVAMFQGRI